MLVILFLFWSASLNKLKLITRKNDRESRNEENSGNESWALVYKRALLQYATQLYTGAIRFADIKALISWNWFIDSYWNMCKNAFIFLHIVIYYIQYCISMYHIYIYFMYFIFVACDIIDLEWNETTTLLLEYEKV